MPHDATVWWTAFGALAQAAAALATFFAVAVALWVALSERALRAEARAAVMVLFAGDGSPGIYMAGVSVTNVGVRPFHVSSVGWRTGWLSRGPEALRYRYALQNTSVMLNERPPPHIIEPGRSEGFYTRIADMKQNFGSDSWRELFERKHRVLGAAPIKALVNITGRKPLVVKVSDDLAHFLRTNEHASTTAENARAE